MFFEAVYNRYLVLAWAHSLYKNIFGVQRPIYTCQRVYKRVKPFGDPAGARYIRYKPSTERPSLCPTTLEDSPHQT